MTIKTIKYKTNPYDNMGDLSFSSHPKFTSLAHILLIKNYSLSPFLEKELGEFEIFISNRDLSKPSDFYYTSCVLNGEESSSKIKIRDSAHRRSVASSVFEFQDISIQKSSPLTLSSFYAIKFFLLDKKKYNDIRLIEINNRLNLDIFNESSLINYLSSIKNDDKELSEAQFLKVTTELVDLIKSPITPHEIKKIIIKDLYKLGLTTPSLPASPNFDYPTKFCKIFAKAIEAIDFKAFSHDDALDILTPEPVDSSVHEGIFSVLSVIENSILSLTNTPYATPENNFVFNWFFNNTSFENKSLELKDKAAKALETGEASFAAKLNNNFFHENKLIRFSSLIAYAVIFIPLAITSIVSTTISKKNALPKLNEFLSLFNIGPATVSTPPYNSLEILGNRILYEHKSFFTPDFKKKFMDIALFNTRSPLFKKAVEIKGYKLNEEIQALTEKDSLIQALPGSSVPLEKSITSIKTNKI